MYEGALPKTGLAVGVGGATLGLSWLIAVGLVVIVAGVLLTRYGRRGNARA
jgi:hypothetical protein